MALAEGSAALVSTGAALYVFRYQPLGFQFRTAGIVLCAALVFIWQSLFSRKSRRLQEEKMKKTLMGLFPECRDQTQLTEAPRIDLGAQMVYWTSGRGTDCRPGGEY